ncbi:MAG: T9SS type A sorting domain-containing protein [Schleiferiaceae bacterium]|nr:T9SS type A sorting domain-containing protein [Schleiferiaceae bacterium]
MNLLKPIFIVLMCFPFVQLNGQLIPASPKSINAIQQNIAFILGQNSSISPNPSQRYGHYIPPAILNNMLSPNSPLKFYKQPLFVDSTVFVNHINYLPVSTHAAAQVFDFNSMLIPSNLVSSQYWTSYDTVFVAGEYRVIQPGQSGLTGDKLRFEIVHGEASNQNVDNQVFFSNIFWPATNFIGQQGQIPLAPIRYNSSPLHGEEGGLSWANKTVIEYDLLVSDTGKTFFKVPLNLQNFISNPPEKIGISVSFIPGYSWNHGEVYYSDKNIVATMNSWSVIYAAAASPSDTGYFVEQLNGDPNSMAVSQWLFNKTRYGAFSGAQDFLNQMYHPGNFGLVMDLWAKTTVASVNEFSALGLKLYPNPAEDLLVLESLEGSQSAINFKIMDIYGKVVMIRELTHLNQEYIDVFSLKPGNYIFQVVTENAAVNQKFTKL